MFHRFLMFAVLFAVSTSLWAADEPTAGRQVEQTMSDSQGDVDYLLYLPREYDADKTKKWPLMLFLHGRGESYGPLELVAKWGPPKFAQRGDDLPFILVSPQCPREGRWTDETRQAQLDRQLTKLAADYRVDTDRIMLTGLSLGGFGSWTLAANHPERFSVVVPICGGGNPADAEKLKQLPIWVFHGDADGAVPIKKSEEMVAALRDVKAKQIRFTSLEHVGHNSWSATYATPELYSWMLKQKASANQ